MFKVQNCHSDREAATVFTSGRNSPSFAAAASEKLKSIYDRQELRTSLEGGEPDKA